MRLCTAGKRPSLTAAVVLETDDGTAKAIGTVGRNRRTVFGADAVDGGREGNADDRVTAHFTRTIAHRIDHALEAREAVAALNVNETDLIVETGRDFGAEDGHVAGSRRYRHFGKTAGRDGGAACSESDGEDKGETAGLGHSKPHYKNGRGATALQ